MLDQLSVFDESYTFEVYFIVPLAKFFWGQFLVFRTYLNRGVVREVDGERLRWNLVIYYEVLRFYDSSVDKVFLAIGIDLGFLKVASFLYA